jgi:hypothetical protein
MHATCIQSFGRNGQKSRVSRTKGLPRHRLFGKNEAFPRCFFFRPCLQAPVEDPVRLHSCSCTVAVISLLSVYLWQVQSLHQLVFQDESSFPSAPLAGIIATAFRSSLEPNYSRSIIWCPIPRVVQRSLPWDRGSSMLQRIFSHCRSLLFFYSQR